MQAAGGLKKRRRRNLAKVTGLPVIQDEDFFDINTMYSIGSLNQNRGGVYEKSSNFTRFSSNSQRPTRDPRFYAHGQNEPDELGSRRPSTAQSSHNSLYSPEEMIGKESRPVLLSANSMTRLKNIMLLGVFSFSFPWKWNGRTHQIDKWKPMAEKLWKVAWTLVTIQSTGLLGFQVYSFLSRMHQMRDPDGSYRPVFMNSFCVLWYAYALSLNICMFFYRDEILAYINTLFTLNKKLVEKYVVDLSEYREGGQIYLNVSILTNITQTFVSITLFIAMPFQPWYLYSYVYKPDRPWFFLIPGSLQEFICIGQVLAVYLLIGWIAVVHANSVEFWLQQAHRNNDTGSTTDVIRESHKAMELYRSLQLLNVHFNSAMAPAAVPIVKMINWTALIPCGYVLIRSMNQKFLNEFPGILTYPFGVIDCVTSSYGMLQLGAEMCDISFSFLNSWSRTKHKDFRRVLVSCPILKMKIGTLYSLSVSTTITYFKSCFDYIIDSIITFS